MQKETSFLLSCHPIIDSISFSISSLHHLLSLQTERVLLHPNLKKGNQGHNQMWSELPLDVLSHIFSFLPPNSLAHALCVCKHWHYCGRLPAFPPRFLPWFLAMPFWRPRSTFCYAHDPDHNTWYSLPMDFTAESLLLVSYLTGGLVLCRFSSSASLRLAVCNPFTRQILALPGLLASRSKPAIGVITGIDNNSLLYYIVIVAGGTSGGSYESTLEMYDSRREGEGWRLVGPMPIEFAVRLTVWTPNESVHTDDGFLYWITSARAYSVVRLDLACWIWNEVKLPMADWLDWAAIFKRRNGRLGLVGGSVGAMGQVWELDMQAGDDWRTVSTVPLDLDMPVGRGGIKCAGAGDAVYLYRELGSDMLVWSETEGREGWNLVKGKSNSGINFSFLKAVSIYPSLSRSLF